MKCPKCGTKLDLFDVPKIQKIFLILELLAEHPKSTIQEIHNLTDDEISIATLYRLFKILKKMEYILDVGMASDVPGKKITEYHQLRSRIYISNVKIIKK